MPESVIVALVAGPLSGIGVLLISWLVNRKKESAETGLTLDQRWKQYAEKLEGRLNSLETRVGDLERALDASEKTVDDLREQINRERQVTRSVIRWALTLRDSLLSLGGTVPPTPVDVELYLNTLDARP